MFFAAIIIGMGYAYGVLFAPAADAFAAVLIGATGIGFAGQCVKISSDSVVQTTIDDAFRGRVFAIYDMSLNIGIIVGTAVAAYLLPEAGQSILYVGLLAGIVALAASIRN